MKESLKVEVSAYGMGKREEEGDRGKKEEEQREEEDGETER